MSALGSGRPISLDRHDDRGCASSLAPNEVTLLIASNCISWVLIVPRHCVFSRRYAAGQAKGATLARSARFEDTPFARQGAVIVRRVQVKKM
jgi:hypothetical protein